MYVSAALFLLRPTHSFSANTVLTLSESIRMATIRICDRCKARNTKNWKPVEVRGYRWMALMDKHSYKHEMIIKVDLCFDCADYVEKKFKKILIS